VLFSRDVLSSHVSAPVPPALLDCRGAGAVEMLSPTRLLSLHLIISSCLSGIVFSVRLSFLSITPSSL
jgi:hypothetical protein